MAWWPDCGLDFSSLTHLLGTLAQDATCTTVHGGPGGFVSEPWDLGRRETILNPLLTLLGAQPLQLACLYTSPCRVGTAFLEQGSSDVTASLQWLRFPQNLMALEYTSSWRGWACALINKESLSVFPDKLDLSMVYPPHPKESCQVTQEWGLGVFMYLVAL